MIPLEYKERIFFIYILRIITHCTYRGGGSFGGARGGGGRSNADGNVVAPATLLVDTLSNEQGPCLQVAIPAASSLYSMYVCGGDTVVRVSSSDSDDSHAPRARLIRVAAKRYGSVIAPVYDGHPAHRALVVVVVP